MELQELTQMEVMEVSGGRRNLGTLYQYTGDPKDRTPGERFRDELDTIITAIFSFDKWLWTN